MIIIISPRLFGRVKSLRKIVSALTMSLLPVLNVFLILFLLISIGVLNTSSVKCLQNAHPLPTHQHRWRGGGSVVVVLSLAATAWQ